MLVDAVVIVLRQFFKCAEPFVAGMAPGTVGRWDCEAQLIHPVPASPMVITRGGMAPCSTGFTAKLSMRESR